MPIPRPIGMMAALGLALFAAGASPRADETPRADEMPPPLVAGVAIPPGRVEEAVGRIDAVIEEIMARTGIPGLAVAVVHDGAVVHARGFGLREAGAPEAVTPDTVFQIASLSKPVGATVVAHEVGAGRVGWDTPMSELLPWFALSDDRAGAMLTVGDLYAHRSGLPDHAGDDLEDFGFDRHTVLERLHLLPLTAFRASYAYTNFGLTAAAEGVAARSGSDWATLSETVLYDPLGMTRTSSRFADFLARDDRAVPHVRTEDGFRPLYQRQPDAQSPAGGVSSTARDLARWMLMVLGGGRLDGVEIAPEAALLPALTPQVLSGPPSVPAARSGFYGFGFNVGVTPAGRVQLSHSGAFLLGAATSMMMLPSAEVGIVTLSNAQPVGAVEAIGASFLDLVQFGAVTRDWLAAYGPSFAAMSAPFGRLAGSPFPADPEPARPLPDYAGRYANSYFGAVEVAQAEDGLVLVAGPKRMEFELLHWTGDTFIFPISDENAPEGSRSVAEFAAGPDGRIERLNVEVFDDAGMGTLIRE